MKLPKQGQEIVEQNSKTIINVKNVWGLQRNSKIKWMNTKKVTVSQEALDWKRNRRIPKIGAP